MKSLFGLLFVAAMLVPQIAQAQSAAPIGVWQGLNSGDYLNIQADGHCSATGHVNVAGTCTWRSSYAGGILTMTYPWVLEPGHIYWNIIWINRGTIMVNSVERFVRRQ